MDVFYQENAQSEVLTVGRATSDEKSSSCELVVAVHPAKKEEIEMEPAAEREVDMTQSIYGGFGGDGAKKTGPFSAKKIIHESDTPHTRPPQGNQFCHAILKCVIFLFL